MSTTEYIKSLKNDGWREIGKGAYAIVFANPTNRNTILKLFPKTDIAYFDFYKFVKRHPNIHFPNFGKLVKINNDYYSLEIEKLQPITTDYYTKQIKIIENIMYLLTRHSYKEIVTIIKNKDGLEWWQRYIQYMNENPSMKKAILLLSVLYKKHIIDLSINNFMLRDDVIVFTDPCRPHFK